MKERIAGPPEVKKDSRPVVWLHCVSVGETNAARALVDAIGESFPDYKLVISTTTETGQALARKLFSEKADSIFYFPLDWKFSVKRALKKIRPELVLIMETELWFNFLRETRKSGAKVILINGRLSEKSEKRYAMMPKFIKRVLANIEMALMQGNEDGHRLMRLGIRSAKVKVTGNIKFDQASTEFETRLTEEFRQRFAISPDAPLILAASTHAPEEKWILEAFKEAWKQLGEGLPRLMIVPRHPERFDEVAAEIAQTGFEWARRSNEPSEMDRSAEVILLDSIGELRAAFPLAEIVFAGGSLIPHGGQNILEPAACRKAIITGPHTMNFASLVSEFLEKGAIIQLEEKETKDIPKQLAGAFAELLRDNARRSKLGENAFFLAEFNRGATAKTIEYLRPYFMVHNVKLRQRVLPELMQR